MQHGDHVLVHAIAYAHASIEAVRRDVGERIVHAEFDVDVGVLLQQRQQPRPEDGGDGVIVRRVPASGK